MCFFCAFIDFLFVRPQTCGCILRSRIYIYIYMFIFHLRNFLTVCLYSTPHYAQICNILYRHMWLALLNDEMETNTINPMVTVPIPGGRRGNGGDRR